MGNIVLLRIGFSLHVVAKICTVEHDEFLSQGIIRGYYNEIS